MLLLVTIGLVLVAAITLVFGIVGDTLPLIYVSIACSVAAGGVLFALSMMGRRSTAATATAAGPAPLTGDAGAAAPERLPAAEEPTRASQALGAEGEFPIADYDDLRVAEILPLLDELTLDELDMVREREEGGKARASVLTRIDQRLDELEAEEQVGAPSASAAGSPFAQVAAGTAGAVSGDGAEEFPIADYDDLKVAEILPLLSDLDADELELVADREERGAARNSVLNRIDQLLDQLEEQEELAGAGAPASAGAVATKAPAKTTTAKTATAKKAPKAVKGTKKATPKKASAPKRAAAAAKPAAAAKKASTGAKKTAAKKTTAKKSAAPKKATPAKKATKKR